VQLSILGTQQQCAVGIDIFRSAFESLAAELYLNIAA
jgi:hypothetical protein